MSERRVGTVSRGIRCPIIREGDNLSAIVTESVLKAAESDGFAILAGCPHPQVPGGASAGDSVAGRCDGQARRPAGGRMPLAAVVGITA